MNGPWEKNRAGILKRADAVLALLANNDESGIVDVSGIALEIAALQLVVAIVARHAIAHGTEDIVARKMMALAAIDAWNESAGVMFECACSEKEGEPPPPPGRTLRRVH